MVATKCRCLYSCPNGALNGTCDLLPGGSCFTFVEKIINLDNDEPEMETRYGCFPPGEGTLLQCQGSKVPHSVPKSIVCCNDKDYCNQDLNPTYFNIESYKDDEIDDYFFELNGYLLLALCFIVFFLLIAIAYNIYCCYKIKKKSKVLGMKVPKNDESLSEQMQFGTNKPLLLTPNLFDPNYEYVFNAFGPRTTFSPPNSYNINSSSTSDSMSSGLPIKYSFLNNISNGSNPGMNYYRNNMSSATSNTMSSVTSENTQQTTLSSQKPSSTSSSMLPPLNEISSGSGSGIPHLVQQTLAMEIQLNDLIGKGRYGNVWRGTRKCENVAVKIFYSRDEASWKRETEIYTTVIMRHENILGFLGADVTSQGGCTQLWLVTDFHELGSLYDFLNQHSVKNIYHLLSLMKSIIFGVSHLHTEVIGTLGKPAIAHRDLKSKNILMKSDFSCCIADFGLAVTKVHINSQVNIPQNHRVGTKRYMAPEILSETVKSDVFEYYRSADIYSLSLVFWELINCLEINGVANDYNVPFHNLVSSDPSFEDMRQIVCIEQLRPNYTMNYDNDPILVSIVNLIKECWSQNPSARLTSLRIKKSIINYIQKVKSQV